MNALYAAARAEAKLAAERTRKKLVDFASALAGEVDDEADYVAGLSRDGAPPDQSNRQDSQDEFAKKKQNAQADPESDPRSYWA